MSLPGQPQLKLIAPPPVLYIGAFLFGWAIHAVSPIWISPTAFVPRMVGGCLLVLSAAFARWAFVTLRRWGTSASPKQPAQALATGGPFQWSRNPIYLAMTGLYLGLACLVNAFWPLILLVPLLLLMDWGVIRREEHYLAATFGETYTAYQSKVRRWLCVPPFHRPAGTGQ